MIGQYGYDGATVIPEPPPDATMDREDESFWGKVAEFKRRADDAMALWSRLAERRGFAATDPKLHAEYNAVMQEAEGISGKIAEIERIANSALSTLGQKFSDFFGLGDAAQGRQFVGRQAGQLGFVQIAAIAIVSAAIAWIASWTGRGYIVDRKLDAVENLVAEGMSPGEAGKLIAEKGAPGFLGTLFQGTGTLALVGVGAMLLYFMSQQKRDQ